MIDALIRGALKQRLVVAVVAAVLLFFGLDAARKLSLDAFPDVTNVQVQIATEAPGRSPEEVERFVTVPVEMAMTGLPALTEMRSLNKPGLSLITLVFTDETDVYFARQLVMERLIEVQSRMPAGVTPVLGPVSTGLGEVYQYTLDKPDDGDKELSVEELTQRRIAQDWVVRPLLRSIPGVAEINSQGGYEKQYQVLVNPERLRHHNVTVKQVFEALAANNANSGGGVLPHFAEQYLIRGVGLVRDTNDIGAIVLKEVNGTPLTIRDVAEVKIGTAVRAGAVVKNGVTESVGGVVMMMRGGNAKEVVARIQERVKAINDNGMLPDGLKIVPYYERSDLVDSALNTVIKVLAEGVVLVVIVLLLFLGDIRSSLIVVGTLVLTPLLTFMAMNKLGISANLMSLGGLAIAIGLMVDGSVVVVENAFAHLAKPRDPNESRARIILHAVTEVATPVIFGVGIIILVFLPLMTLQGMEGKMFAPLAFTIAIALFISLVLSLTLTPVLSSYLLKPKAHPHVEGEHGDHAHDKHAEHDAHDTWLIRKLKKPYLRLLELSLNNGRKTVVVAVAVFFATGALMPFLGTAFIPEMKEGSVVPGINRAPNISLEESIRMEMEAMRLVMQVPGVKSAVSGVGRGESPADPQGQNESTPIVSLKPRDEWPKGWNQDDIAEAMRKALQVLPGVQIVMAQPISDRVDEMVTGVRSDVAIKVFGDDLNTLREKAEAIAKVAQGIHGAQDMRVERITGQQYLQIAIDRQAIARHGLNAADVHNVIETAIGGKEATEIFEGERRFSAVVRLPDAYRGSVEAIRNLIVAAPNGAQVPMESIARIEVTDGPAQISRELGKRRVVVGVNVRDRDLGGFVAELQSAVAQKVKLPEGYYLEWGGQFQNMERAMGHLQVIVPITVAAIFFLLFLLFNSVRYATLIILVLPFASVGGIIGLFVTGEYLSVPASVGFVALWGIAVLNGVVLVSTIRSLREQGMSVAESVRLGARMRFRPVMMTATVAMLGLIPFLFATGPGSEVQRPLAIVVIGGLLTCTLLTLVMLPTLYKWFDEEAKA
ncbi:efflux RND transporter permease subunit [Ralstonia mannitolilytica]|uniref:Cation efflux system protein CzcA n=1 Tax=Ralstonia mannitolilytica TaxID=105219 RepID=A0AAJ4ZQ17_9RALS|nr:efflux RND transporter permease subunit [Ralstonia mannitolilytica]AJW46569.1 cytochrome C peroxidase [Ralstonia mannitolilytica]MBU9576825.1 efflux RND transporter permease subunit [Ralstonia mannitolilytica]QIF09931.1 efflux RND transporter permease subunit [Ralstonia mannitolilytica]CAG2132176.1 Cobalt-zinc-cadmium resistance protein CzcA [Ralstonia mannitolilytica]CAJ0729531.1 Cobalt-zinc-cadmium resistance protein CzcA [Ralstonia mannitolilytica]